MPRPIPAGTWNLVGDGLIQGPARVRQMTVQWQLVWHKSAGPEQVILSWDHTYVRDPAAPDNAIGYATSGPAAAVPIAPQDQLLMRMKITAGDADGLWAPNGDGSDRNGKIPHFELPQ